MSHTTANAPVGAVSILRFVDAVLNFVNKISAGKELRATRRALYALSDEQLTDIGVTRADIANI